MALRPLTEIIADLADADLADARNVPTGVERRDPPSPYIRGAARTPEFYAARAAKFRERHPDVSAIPDLDAQILDAIEVGGGALDMSTWHTCETTHCRAGWAITLAGKPGAELERRYGPQRAGAMIYRASTGRVPHFFATDDRALADIRERAAEQVAGSTEQP
jgi:hypothetical protein